MKDQALTVTQETALEAVPSRSSEMLQSILDAARDPTVDANKMTVLADLAMRLEDRETQKEFNRAKAAAILEMPSIGRRGEIRGKGGEVQSRFSKWEDLHKVITPILARHGLVLNFDVGSTGSLVTVCPILSHVNGHTERGGAMPLAVDTTGSKNATQGAGSAVSYGKRHTAKATLNIIEHNEDDDGQGASRGRELSSAQSALIDAGRAAALHGGEHYETWYKQQEAAARGWLVVEGYHAENKKAAGLA